jgi:serine phosphatase RsbU (regulator of sigma subunit)
MGKDYKILVADDSTSVHQSIKLFFSETDDARYIVLSAFNGQEAINMVQEENPDLILIDIEMPVMKGVEAISKLKSDPKFRGGPIIVMSSTKQFQKAIDAGATDFLIKPFDKYELLLRINLNLQLSIKQKEIRHQHELLKAQRQEAIDQRDIIEKQKIAFTDDLTYARFIQSALLPSKDLINALFTSHFIFNRPKSIVSGDFYWVASKKDTSILAVGDCTGHGVSGALMTIAGTAFLNEIIATATEITSDYILNSLRSRVIHLLNQNGEIGEASNGMDIAIILYNEEKQKLQFSGANNPMYIIRQGGPLEIFKGDRMPIGFYVYNDIPFTRIDLQVSKGDKVYLFSDGYPDQFGGPRGQKFRYNQFQDLIKKASLLPMVPNQYELIKNTMDNWINGYEQIDDMLVVGVTI